MGSASTPAGGATGGGRGGAGPCRTEAAGPPPGLPAQRGGCGSTPSVRRAHGRQVRASGGGWRAAAGPRSARAGEEAWHSRPASRVPGGSRAAAVAGRALGCLSPSLPFFFYFYFFRSLLPCLSCADASGLNAEPGLIASYPPGESWAGPLPGLSKRGGHLRQARLCVTPFIAVQYVFTCRWGREVLRRAVGVLQRAENVFLTVCIRSIQGVPSVFQMR